MATLHLGGQSLSSKHLNLRENFPQKQQQQIIIPPHNPPINHFSLQQQQQELSHKWREVQGANDWLGLLPTSLTSLSSSTSWHRDDDDRIEEQQFPKSPAGFIDEELRAEILKYGQFSQLCYDAFNNDEDSHLRGSCIFPPENLPTLPGYQVTSYLYATAHSDLPSFFAKPASREDAWSNDSNWMGYIAVSTSQEEISRLGRREIVIAWRGTVTGLEWLQNLHDFLRPTGLDPSDRSTEGVKVESGFLNMYTSRNPRSRYNQMSARDQVLAEVKRLVEKYRGEPEELSITVTGHSLGGALALLSAYDIAEMEINRGIQTTVVSFSAPRVGNRVFGSRCRELGLRALRVLNRGDFVPKVPGIVFNEHHPVLSSIVERVLPWTYEHFGTEIGLDCSASPYLRKGGDLVAQHNLEALLHLVDGYQGPWREFRPSGRRDLALVNKDSDLLLPECGVPGFWRKRRLSH